MAPDLPFDALDFPVRLRWGLERTNGEAPLYLLSRISTVTHIVLGRYVPHLIALFRKMNAAGQVTSSNRGERRDGDAGESDYPERRRNGLDEGDSAVADQELLAVVDAEGLCNCGLLK
ncbi:hypothetical protein M407DRAFT_23700 [Tulasnella calospora MUT 4182]|uniref:Uncharacterized protein n=1 Tax=Tulasnella calospora MUT 4182 TaxID=1051891 RepID=A0A0C3L010_9AGAM|nr:hypothetical protein M407DRAFT_23700 [Tulasnella calospora MUT 4182]